MAKRKYTLTPKAYAQRQLAPLKHARTSKVWKDIIEREDENGRWKDEFMKYKLEVWQQLAVSPLMYLAEEVSNVKAYITMLLDNGKIDHKLYMQYTRLLLDFVKELNKYREVTADTKANLAKVFLNKEEPIEVDVVDLTKNGEGNTEKGDEDK